MSSYKKYSDLGENKDMSALTNTANNTLYSTQKSNGENVSPHSGGGDKVLEIEDHDHKLKLITDNLVVVVDIYGDWCGPCKAITSRYSQLAENYSRPGVVFAREDVDKKISTRITGIPAFQYFVNGKMYTTTTGADMVAVKETVDDILKAQTSKKFL